MCVYNECVCECVHHFCCGPTMCVMPNDPLGLKVRNPQSDSEVCDPRNNAKMMLALLIIPSPPRPKLPGLLFLLFLLPLCPAGPLTACFVVPAIDLINNLLQVKMRKRYSVDKSLSHPWLQVSHRFMSADANDAKTNAISNHNAASFGFYIIATMNANHAKAISIFNKTIM